MIFGMMAKLQKLIYKYKIDIMTLKNSKNSQYDIIIIKKMKK
jgi:hypothetical protein